MQPAIWHWWAFVGFVLAMLAIDLAAARRRTGSMTAREAIAWTAFWTGLALGFAGLIWWGAGIEPAARFLTGYLIEWSLSLDNIFVFVVIFATFRTPREHQHRVLFWGVLGAIVMRLAFVLAGMALIKQFEWVMPLLGVLIVVVAIRLALHGEPHVDPSKNILVRLARRLFSISDEPNTAVAGLPTVPPAPTEGLPIAPGDLRSGEWHGQRPATATSPVTTTTAPATTHGKFFVRGADGRRRATTLFLTLLAIEGIDLLFAIDSVPAIFGVTSDPFLVFSSNIMAILGLRSLYFLLAGLMDRFRYLNYGISAVLLFVGGKMIAEEVAKRAGWIPHDHELVPYWVSLCVVVGLIGCSMIVSAFAKKKKTVDHADGRG
jgi:tellurite resistance protein TerC